MDESCTSQSSGINCRIPYLFGRSQDLPTTPELDAGHRLPARTLGHSETPNSCIQCWPRELRSQEEWVSSSYTVAPLRCYKGRYVFACFEALSLFCNIFQRMGWVVPFWECVSVGWLPGIVLDFQWDKLRQNWLWIFCLSQILVKTCLS